MFLCSCASGLLITAAKTDTEIDSELVDSATQIQIQLWE